MQTTATMSITDIGNINNGIDGTEIYLLVTCDEASTKQQVNDFVMERYYKESTGPGYKFCNNCTVIPKPYYDSEFIVIVHIRYDV